MIRFRILLSKVKPRQIAPIVSSVIILLSATGFLPMGEDSNAEAQGLFPQPIRVNVDKSNYVLGDYGLIIMNRDTGNSVKNYYTDSEGSPQTIYVDGTIGTYSGDTLVACIMNMATKEIACDTQTAYYSDDTTEFFVDMNDATRVSD